MNRVARLFQSAANRILARAGYSLIPNWRLGNRGLAQHLGRLFSQCDVDCIIDVGANEGGYATFLRQEVGFQGLIHSFEPVSRLADRCRELAKGDPSWHVHQCALGEVEGVADINVMVSSVFSSFLEPSTDSTSVFQDANTLDHIETVSIRTLEGVIPSLKEDGKVCRPYLKIDTQGFDMAVIRGAGAMLNDMVAIQTELSFRPLYRDMPNWREVLSLLQDRQFEVSNMFAVTIDTDLRALEFDCVLVNNRFVRPST